MKEKICELINDKLDHLGVFIDSVVYEKEDNNNYLRIVLDSQDIISLDVVVEATKIINPILDSNDTLIEETYILDVYAKSKGDE